MAGVCWGRVAGSGNLYRGKLISGVVIEAGAGFDVRVTTLVYRTVVLFLPP